MCFGKLLVSCFTWTVISLSIIYSTEVEFAILNAMLDANAKKLGSDGFSKLQKC